MTGFVPDDGDVFRRFFRTTRIVYAGVLDASGCFIAVSRAALDGIGATSEQIVGSPIWDTPWFCHREESRSAVRRLYDRAMAGEIAHEDIWNDTAGGAEILVRGSAEPGAWADGKVTEVLVSGFDDTPRWHAVEKQDLILREADHRMKNILTIVQAVARLSARSTSSMDEFLAAFDQRLVSLDASHGLSTAAFAEDVEVERLLRVQLAPFADADWSQFSIEGPPVMVAAAHLQTLGLVLHEFATNAAKFGALSTPGGRISIAWTAPEPDGEATLTWRESGGPEVSADRTQGFGTGLVRALLADGAAPVLEFPPEGFRAVLRFAATA